MRTHRLCALLVFGTGLGWSSQPAEAQPRQVFVNTTEDLPVEQQHCLPQQICTLRAAIEKVQQGSGGVVRACYAAAEVPNGKPCRGSAKPLTKSDPGYDANTGKWVFEFTNDIAYTFSSGAAQIDFTLDIEGWAGPEDNKIVISDGDQEMEHALIIESSHNVLKGFEITGSFGGSAITVRKGLGEGGATENQLGPGLVFAGIRPGIGVRISHRDVHGNRFVGNWCGVTGDGTERASNQEDCVQLVDGTGRNVIGGPNPEDRNIFAASSLGVGVSVEGGTTIENTIQGNWFGLDARGNKLSNTAGITIKDGAIATRILGNVISGNAQSGITIFDASNQTEIRGNTIGESPDRSTCIGNGNYGISLSGRPSNSLITENRVACNASGGVIINGAGTKGNRVTQNSITNNDGDAIRVGQGANGGIRLPTINNTTATRVSGNSCPACLVEVYSDPGDEADAYEGSVKADAATGLFIFDKPQGFQHVFVKVTGTDPSNNTSGLSQKRSVPLGRTPTASPSPTNPPTPTPPTGTVVATATDKPVIHDIFVPWVAKVHDR